MVKKTELVIVIFAPMFSALWVCCYAHYEYLNINLLRPQLYSGRLLSCHPGSRHRDSTVMDPGQRYRQDLTSRAPEIGGPRSPCDKSPRTVSPRVILL
jgi:hypothetical protein